MPASINLGTTSQVSTNSTPTTCKVTSQSLKKSFSFQLDQIRRSETMWENYILGVVNEFLDGGFKLSGIDVSISSSLPMGSGLSSSAALICSLAWGINSLFAFNLSRKEVALLCQRAEHNFVGIKSGIMDQYTSMLGKKDHVILLDCQSLKHSYIPLNLDNYELLIFNTNVRHALAATAYNERVEECAIGLNVLRKHYPRINALKEATLKEVQSIESFFSPNVFNRCVHVITENLRVIETKDALLERNYNAVGKAMTASHKSLKTQYEVSCAELDFLVDYALEVGGEDVVLGSRMMGGGFGGCTINLVRSDANNEWIKKLSLAYQSLFGKLPSVIKLSSADGCRILD